MLDRIKQDVVKIILTVQVRSQEDVQAVEPEPAVSNVRYQHAEFDDALAHGGNGDAEAGAGGAEAAVAVAAAPPFVRASQKVGRNDPCPCGSGKKYKHCHGRLG
jgi:preprotein translocase subunit SecA